MATTLVAIDKDDVKHYLTIIKGQPVTLDLNFKDITDLKTKGSHTYNFRLASTVANDKFFSNYFMVGSFSDGTNNNYDPYSKAEAFLLEDGIEVFSGSLQLTNVFLREGNRYEYEVIVYASSVSLMDDLKGVKISDLDLSDYEHTPTVGSVYDSWNNNQIDNGNVIYSLYDYGNGNATSLSETFVNASAGNVAQAGENMFNISKLRPQVQVKSLLIKILAHKGYTYTSAFFDTVEFAKIFTDCNYNGSDTLESVVPNSTYKVATNNLSSFTVDYTQMFASLKTPNESIDLYNDFDVSTFRYKPTVSGLYQYTTGFTINPTGDLGGNSPAELRIMVVDTNTGVNGIETLAICNTINVGSSTNSYTAITQVQLDSSKYYEVQLYTPNGSDYNSIAGSPMAITNASVQIDLLEAAVSINTVSIGVLLSGLGCLDFFQSIIKKFNLVVIPNKENSKNLYIEPYKDFMSTSISKDWSKKINFKKDVQIVPPTKLAGKNIVFKDTPSLDYVYQSFAKIYPYTYGEFTEYLGNEFSEKDTIFTSIFSPTIAYPMVSGGFYSSPIIVPDGDGFKNTGGIRLSFYHGIKTIPNGQRIRLTDTYFQTQNNSGYSVANVPYFSPFSERDFTNSTTVYTLNWGCTLTEDIVTWEGIPLKGLAFKYWLAYIKNNFDKNARMLIAYLWLTPRDISDFNFNDTIRINGEDYIVNSIKGYPVSGAGVCKVELLKTYGTFTSFNVFADGVDCGTVDDYTVFYGIIKDNLGALLTNQGCCEALGWYYYNGLIGNFCYNTPNPDGIPDTEIKREMSTNNDIIGNTNTAQFTQGGKIRGSYNTVINGGKEIVINGDKNIVKSKSSQLNITGNSNLINEQVTKTTIVGNSNEIKPYSEYQILNGEKLNYTNSLTNINITGKKGKALNNNEIVLANGSGIYLAGQSQTVTHIVKASSQASVKSVWIGKRGTLTSYPNTANYNTDLGINSFRLPQKTIISLRIILEGTTGGSTNTLNSQNWQQIVDFKILSGTAPIILSSNLVSKTQTSNFVGADLEIQPTSNIPYLYNSYLIKLSLPFQTLVNNCDYNIKTEYTSTPLIGVNTSNLLPTEVTGLKLWLDASNFSSLGFNSAVGNGQAITQWTDKSGGNNHVLQNQSTYMPKYYNGDINRGRPYIDFDGTTAVMFTTDSDLISLSNSDNTFIVVFEGDTTNNEVYGQVLAGINTSNGSPRAGICVNPSTVLGGAGANSVSYYNALSNTSRYRPSIASAGVTDPKIVVGRKGGTALDIIDENGITNTGTGSTTNTGYYFTVGGRFNGTYDYSEFNGRIHEVIVYDRKITDLERDNLIFYLKNKWNII